MKDRPILFSAPMVRAILSGQKSQTRRIVKPRKDLGFGCLLTPGEIAGEVNNLGEYSNCPYGPPESRLWVRETWNGPFFDEDSEVPDDAHTPKYCQYRADGGAAPEYIDAYENLVCRWRPSIFMPRWASRITLEITGVRVERLQDISGVMPTTRGLQLGLLKPCATATNTLA